MRNTNIGSYLLMVGMAVAITACSGGSTPSAATSNGTSAALPFDGMNPGAPFRRLNFDAMNPKIVASKIHPLIDGARPISFTFHRNHRKSWVSPNVARRPRILYVSDGRAQTIDIFSMPDLVLVGQITVPEIEDPYGMCTDNRGNIWVADAGLEEVIQFSRAGAFMQSLSVPGWPWGCAVNKLNGDLAVMNESVPGGDGTGDVEVFTNATGTPTHYTNPTVAATYYFGGYDPQGNLYVDGLGSGTGIAFTLQELPAGGSQLQTLDLTGGSIGFGGFVEWYPPGNYLAVGDQYCSFYHESACVYQINISGSSANITGVTYVTKSDGSPICSIPQGAFETFGRKVFTGGDFDFCNNYKFPYAYRWNYPAGGIPTNTTTATIEVPFGNTISVK